jgi:hypothetical protein
VVVGAVRYACPEKWVSDFDLIARFAVPLMNLYPSGASALFAVVLFIVKARLILGFARNGDDYRRSRYFRSTVVHNV